MTRPAPPSVSIVRVIDPALDAWTPLALARLAKHTPDAHEVIESVVQTTFGAAANRGAIQARGEHLVVMRGDTLVTPGWLESLLSTSPGGDTVVTPNVIGLDGTTLAAGFQAARDGGLVVCGHGDARLDSLWSFVREVSVPSPACFIVPRRAFLAAGGFDQSVRGTPLVEAADLAFTLRARGHRVLFQPESSVQIAGMPDVATPLGPSFRRRWAQVLETLPPFGGRQDTRSLVEVRDGYASARLLVVDDRVPHGDRGGGDPRMSRILAELSASWPSLRITLFALSPDNGEVYGRALRQAGIEVVYGAELGEWLSSRRYLFDVVMISRPRPLLDIVRASQPQARLIYDMEAVHVRRHQRMLAVVPPDETATVARAVAELLPIEVGLIAAADVVWCVSEDDRSFARSIAPATPAQLVAHGVDAPASVPAFDERRGLLFFGAFWNPGSPNEDAVRYLVRQVMPLVWVEEPSIRLTIVGADPTPDVLRLAGPRVEVVGYVADPGVALARARVHVAPIRIGAGIKLRLIDSMAAGLPFVTTTVGAEGLPLESLRSTLVADTPFEMARRALALYRNRDSWTRVQQRMRDIAHTHYSAAALRRQLADAMAMTGIAPPRSWQSQSPW